MDEPQRSALTRPALKLDALDTEAVRPLTTAEYCERVYSEADGDPDRVPWAQHGPDELLVQWLNRDGPRIVRPGSRALVVGCGLGDDVAELAARGFDAMGFDVSPTAVRWAARRHPDHAARFLQANLLDLPARLLGRFDLVVEIGTLQSLTGELRTIAARNIAQLASSRGVVLAVSCGRHCEEDCPDAEGPPWPLSTRELESLFASAGLGSLGGAKECTPAGDEGHVRVMGLFVRG
jgi:SAM-dependent methyltransferase